jgi:hypothetical protein
MLPRSEPARMLHRAGAHHPRHSSSSSSRPLYPTTVMQQQQQHQQLEGGLNAADTDQVRELLRVRDLTTQLARDKTGALLGVSITPAENAHLRALNDRLEQFLNRRELREEDAKWAPPPPGSERPLFDNDAHVWYLADGGQRNVPAVVKYAVQDGATDYPAYLIESEVTGKEKMVREHDLVTRGAASCPVCLEDKLLCTLKPCGHGVCREDAERLGGLCPLCRAPFREYVCQGQRYEDAGGDGGGGGDVEDEYEDENDEDWRGAWEAAQAQRLEAVERLAAIRLAVREARREMREARREAREEREARREARRE